MSDWSRYLNAGIKRLIRPLGYTTQKLPPAPRKSFDVVEMLVAGKTIRVYGGSPLRHVYATHPGFNTHLGSLAALIHEKYPNGWAVDVGANVGDTLAIIRSKASMPVICVEGDTHCHQLLQENARQFEDVHIFNVFLAEKAGTARMQLEKEGWNTTLSVASASQANGGSEINFQTLDGLTSGLGQLEKIKLLKVDTEGFDMRILRGAADILQTAHPVVAFELNKENIAPLGDSVPDFFEFLTRKGFNNFLLADPDGKPICTLREDDQRLFSNLYKFSGPRQATCYFDVWAFYREDADLFDKFVAVHDSLVSS